MKDNEITSFDKELNEFLQPKCLIIQETPGYRTKSVCD